MPLLPYNQPILLERKRDLRRNQTIAEETLWRQLRGKRCEGAKFFRQYSVGSYILDFYCPNRRLAVEVDGEYHEKNSVKEYDEIRTDFLRGYEIEVLRFSNEEVDTRLVSVMSKIVETLRNRMQSVVIPSISEPPLV